MKRLRQVIFWMHLCTALAVGVVVLIMSVTGVLLTYQRRMTWRADTRGLDSAPPAAGQTRLASDALLLHARAAHDGTPTSVVWRSDADAPAVVAFGRERTLYLNAYTGAVLGNGSERIRAFFRVVTDWHRWLAASDEDRRNARRITGVSNLAFLFIVLSGFYLWWPRNWTGPALRNVVMFRRGLPGKARDFNWHNVIGFWSALPLAVVVASATVISYPWATNLVYRLAGDPVSPADAGGGSSTTRADAASADTAMSVVAPAPAVSALEARAEQQVPGWTIITLQIPATDDGTVRFTIDTGDGGQPHRRGQLTLDAGTGDVVEWAPFSSGTRGRRVRSILRFAHTGEVAGLAGQTVAGLVSLGAVFLVWTGFALTLRRFAAWRRRRART